MIVFDFDTRAGESSSVISVSLSTGAQVRLFQLVVLGTAALADKRARHNYIHARAATEHSVSTAHN